MRYRTLSPVLIIAFNRPEQTQALVNALRTVQVPRLYVAADAPRDNVPSDSDACARTLEIFQTVDWECKVSFKVNKKNKGSYTTIPLAIDWFLSNEIEGIILEDDCIPSSSFFNFCDVLLEKYRDNENAMWINGSNVGFQSSSTTIGFMESIYGISWGWATWRGSWNLMRRRIEAPPRNGIDKKLLSKYLGRRFLAQLFWRAMFKYAYTIRNWDYRALYGMWESGGIAFTPTVNLISNIGAANGAVHGRRLINDKRFNLPVEEWEEAVEIHSLGISENLDRHLEKEFHHVELLRIIKVYLIATFPKLRTWGRFLLKKPA